MAQFVFTGDVEMIYVDVIDPSTGHTLIAVPNETYTLDVAPDELFVAATKSSKPSVASPAPISDPAPTTDAPAADAAPVDPSTTN